MGKVKKCDECEIRFPSIGSLKSETRVQQHMKVPHMVPCEKCDKMFVSITHKKFHRYFSHEPQCPHCNQLCEGRCSGLYGVAAEKEGGGTMEEMKQGRISTINDTEGTVEEMVEQITIGKVELMQNYASYLDVGYIDCESDMWSTLIYYPSPEMPKKSMSEYTYWYTFMDLYMAVLDRLTDCLQTVKIQMRILSYSLLWAHYAVSP